MTGCWYDDWLIYWENNCGGVERTGSVSGFDWGMLVSNVIVGLEFAGVDGELICNGL